MKWFMHETDSIHSEKLNKIIEEFGFQGYGRYWRIMELVAERMDFTGKCSLELPEKEWLRYLVVRRPLFHRYLVVICQLFDIHTITTGSLIRIEIPNLLKKKDNASRNLQVKKEKIATKEVEKEKEEINKNIKPIVVSDEKKDWKIKKQEAFEKAWTDYPGTPDNKKQSNGHWNASIKTPADIVAYELALEGYLRMIQTCGYDRSFKGAKTWFNNWQDYIRVEETPALTEPDNPAPLPAERIRGEPELEKLWDNTLEKIKAHILPEAHEAWFEVVYPCRMEEGILMIACPNQFTRKGMIENYRDLIEITTKEFHGSPVLVDFCVIGGVPS